MLFGTFPLLVRALTRLHMRALSRLGWPSQTRDHKTSYYRAEALICIPMFCIQMVHEAPIGGSFWRNHKNDFAVATPKNMAGTEEPRGERGANVLDTGISVAIVAGPEQLIREIPFCDQAQASNCAGVIYQSHSIFQGE